MRSTLSSFVSIRTAAVTAAVLAPLFTAAISSATLLNPFTGIVLPTTGRVVPPTYFPPIVPPNGTPTDTTPTSPTNPGTKDPSGGGVTLFPGDGGNQTGNPPAPGSNPS